VPVLISECSDVDGDVSVTADDVGGFDSFSGGVADAALVGDFVVDSFAFYVDW
jgi:hypothetical protein